MTRFLFYGSAVSSCKVFDIVHLLQCLPLATQHGETSSSPADFEEGSDVHPGIQKLNVTRLQEWRSGSLDVDSLVRLLERGCSTSTNPTSQTFKETVAKVRDFHCI